MITVMQRGTVRGRVLPATIRRRAARLLEAIGRPEDDLCVLLTDDAEIQELNRAWRQKDKPTDVLSFSQLEGDVPAPRPAGVPVALGDVVISLETAAEQVADGCLPRLWAALGDASSAPPWDLLSEVTFLLLHGTLHLVGHDHERDDERVVMEAREAELLPSLLSGRGGRRTPAAGPRAPGDPERTARPR
jgi:probable rRNA maturation factor